MLHARSGGQFCAYTSAHVAAATLIVVVMGVSPTPAGAQRGIRNQVPTQQAIMVNGQWSAYLKQADVFQTAAPGGGFNAQVTVSGETLGAPLMTLISSSLTGDVKPAEVQLATFDLTRFIGTSALVLSGARIQEITFPAADASSTALGLFAVKFSQDTATQEVPPAGSPPGLASPRYVRQNQFRVDIDGISGAYVTSVAPVVVPLAEKRGPLPPLTLKVASGMNAQAQQAFAGWQQWFASGESRKGSLTFMAADMRPLLVEQFSGLRVASISSTAGVSTVTLTAAGMQVESAEKLP